MPAQVRVELAPWEKRIGEVAGRISVVVSERDVLAKKVGGARHLQATLCCPVAALCVQTCLYVQTCACGVDGALCHTYHACKLMMHDGLNGALCHS